MKLNAGVIADEMSIHCPILFGPVLYELDLSTPVLPFKDMVEPRADALYIIGPAQLGIIDSLPHESTALFVDVGDATTYAPLFKNALVIRDGLSTEEAIFDLQGIFRKYERWEHDVLTAIAAHKSIEEVLNLCVLVLRNPIELADPTMAYIAHAGALPDDLSGSAWELVFRYGYPTSKEMSDEVERALHDDVAIQHEMGVSAKVLRSSDRLESGANLPIVCNGQVVGLLNFVDINAPLTTGELSLFRYLRIPLALTFDDRETMSITASGRNKALGNLLKGSKAGAGIIEQLFRSHGWKTDDWLRILRFHPRDSLRQSLSPLDPFATQISNRLGAVLTTPYENDIVVIQHLDSCDEPLDEEPILKLLGQLDLDCGVSRPFKGIDAAALAASQAELVLPLAEDRKEPVRFEGSEMTLIASFIEHEVNPWVFSHPKTEALLDTHDPITYVRCLKVYIANGLNMHAAARALFMDRSSLRYRIARIEELMGIRLDELPFEELLCLYYSMFLLEQRLAQTGQ